MLDSTGMRINRNVFAVVGDKLHIKFNTPESHGMWLGTLYPDQADKHGWFNTDLIDRGYFTKTEIYMYRGLFPMRMPFVDNMTGALTILLKNNIITDKHVVFLGDPFSDLVYMFQLQDIIPEAF